MNAIVHEYVPLVVSTQTEMEAFDGKTQNFVLLESLDPPTDHLF